MSRPTSKPAVEHRPPVLGDGSVPLLITRAELMRSVFLEALARPGPERTTYLRAACGADEELRRDVEDLLRAEEETVEGTTTGGAEPDADDGPVLAPGTIVGDCTIAEVVGEGGSSVVYRARQRGVDRPVAVKVLRAPAASRQSRWRFTIEARVLGRLDHPGIARVFGSGVSGDGRPYLLMEYIDGRAITEACTGLSAREKVRLFLGVCDAVQAAHRSGVIHRDIKPGNVLVESVSGAVKLLDFGIARMTDGSALHTAHTHAGTLLGTAAYMSPEQAAGHHDAVGTTSDVFSLGVLLFEMLTGRTPRPCFGGSGPRSARLPLDEQLRRMRTEPAPPLSRFDRSLRGDLETVMARALELAPARRYQSPDELRADLARWLERRPVQARRTGAWYRARLWVRRHRAAAATIALVVSLAVLAAVMAAKAWRLERREYEGALSHYALLLDSLVDEAAKRTATREFRLGIVRGAAERLEQDLAHRPDDPRLLALSAKAVAALGSIRLEEARYEEALKHQERALSLLQRAVEARPGDRAVRVQLAEQMVRVGDVVGRMDPGRRRAMYERAHGALVELQGQNVSDARVLDSLAWSHERLGVLVQRELGPAASLPYFRRQLEAAETLLVLAPDEIGSVYALCEALQQVGGALAVAPAGGVEPDGGRARAAELERIAWRGLEAARELETLAPDQVRSTHVLVRSLSRMSGLERRAGRLEQARTLSSESLTRAERLLARDERNSVAVWCVVHAMDEFIALHLQARDFAEALALADRKIAMLERTPGGGGPGSDFEEALLRTREWRAEAVAGLAADAG